MRVGISLLTLVPGISGGTETYVRELARALGRVGEHDYDALVPTLAPDAADGLRATVAAGYRASRTTAGRLGAMALATVRPGAAGARLDACDVVHFPLTVPVPRTRRPRVITLHDVQHLDLPQLFPRGERLFRRLAYDRAARRATRVIAISSFVRERAVERLGLRPDRVDVVPLGVDHDRFAPDASVAREPYLLYPARPWPHKNHARLFAAFALLRTERPDLRLVLTGTGHVPSRLPEGVESRGDVSPEELVQLYRRASALVFPSLYEGFGLPPLEAMACGCPVAASSAGALPEVCGDAAVLFDPFAPEAIAHGVRTALARSEELAAAGPRHAAGFTWAATAQGHDAAYRLAGAGP